MTYMHNLLGWFVADPMLDSLTPRYVTVKERRRKRHRMDAK
jgi:hypothetical protein